MLYALRYIGIYKKCNIIEHLKGELDVLAAYRIRERTLLPLTIIITIMIRYTYYTCSRNMLVRRLISGEVQATNETMVNR